MDVAWVAWIISMSMAIAYRISISIAMAIAIAMANPTPPHPTYKPWWTSLLTGTGRQTGVP